MPDVPVSLPESSYTIRIESGLLHRAGADLRLFSATRALVITDSHVSPLHLPSLTRSLESAGIEPIVVTLLPGEENKVLASLLPVYDTILGSRIERSTPVLALGGGIVGDMAGFVAATTLRGLPLVQIPTTLLAMVDSSVGGKTGVNHAVGKNLIGAFHHPVAVFADPEVLTTLATSDFIDGLAECIKHDIIRDSDGFASLENNVDRILQRETGLLTELVAHNVRIKARVVEADPLEHGERAHLNYGHTFGHAIERVSRHGYSHGQAVALGMVAAARLACDLGMLDAGSVDRIIRLIDRTGLPVGNARLDADEVVTAMGFDKKVKSSRLRFILPDRIGHVVIRDDVPTEWLQRAVRSIVAA